VSYHRLPASLEPLVAGYRFERVSIGQSGVDVFRLTHEENPTLFLKCTLDSASAELHAEAERLRWLSERAPVPRVIALVSESLHIYLLMRALPGRSAAEIGPQRVRAAATGLATALRRLHAQPITGCPFDERLATRIERAAERAGAGLVDEADFDPERQGRRAADLLEQLQRERPEEEELVLTHGDACLPNVIFEGNRFTGFVDCGRAGIADRYQDLALAERSIIRNWGAEWVPLFFQTYGLVKPNRSKLAYYCLLDEFF
jgi:aminoglycoside 3'-phosphotransferase II